VAKKQGGIHPPLLTKENKMNRFETTLKNNDIKLIAEALRIRALQKKGMTRR